MEWIDPELVHEFVWLIAKALLSVGLSWAVFNVTHNKALPFICFAVFWLGVLAKRLWH